MAGPPKNGAETNQHTANSQNSAMMAPDTVPLRSSPHSTERHCHAQLWSPSGVMGEEQGWQGHLLEGEERGEINNNKMLKPKHKSDKELCQIKTLTRLGMTMVRANTEYSLCVSLKTCYKYLFPSSSRQPSNIGIINSLILNIGNWGDRGIRIQAAGLQGP